MHPFIGNGNYPQSPSSHLTLERPAEMTVLKDGHLSFNSKGIVRMAVLRRIINANNDYAITPGDCCGAARVNDRIYIFTCTLMQSNHNVWGMILNSKRNRLTYVCA